MSDPTQQPSTLTIRLVLLVNQIYPWQKEQWQSHQLSSGITTKQFLLLHALRAGPLSPAMLARQFPVTPKVLTQLIQRLVEAGLVDREPHRHDRRQFYARLTPAGEEVVRYAAHEISSPLPMAIATLTADERAALGTGVNLLESVVAQLNAIAVVR